MVLNHNVKGFIMHSNLDYQLTKSCHPKLTELEGIDCNIDNNKHLHDKDGHTYNYYLILSSTFVTTIFELQKQDIM